MMDLQINVHKSVNCDGLQHPPAKLPINLIILCWMLTRTLQINLGKWY